MYVLRIQTPLTHIKHIPQGSSHHLQQHYNPTLTLYIHSQDLQPCVTQFWLHWVFCHKYSVEQGHVHAKVPLMHLIPHIPISDLICVTSTHNIMIHQEIQSDRDSLIPCFKDHHCPSCNSNVSIFTTVYKKPCLKSSSQPTCVFSAGGSQRKTKRNVPNTRKCVPSKSCHV